ncbi:MAG TPA: stage II sporulation protein P [Firmicutes bacterium]|nr:stage II sporulation protein P [Bacillota bacterium]
MRLFRRAAALFLCVCVICFIARSGLLDKLGKGDTAVGAAYFSAMLAMPEGAAAGAAAADGEEDEEPYIPDPQIVEAPVLSSRVSAASQPSAADPADTVGKILPKFISPYTAGLHWNKIYIRNMTSKEIDLEAEMAQPLSWAPAITGEPEVLILHTHATESYMPEDRDFYTADDPTHSEDDSQNVVRVGEAIAQQLTAAGIGVIHDKTLHDKASYTGSYGRSAETAARYLEEYPSIKVILDVHRDSVSSGEKDKVKPVVEVDGRQAAQIMLVVGCEDGKVTDFPNWRENFRLAIRMQQTCEELYPGLARPMYFAPKKYNQNLSPGSMLFEMGTEANTLEEAVYAGELAGKALAQVLLDLK